MLRHALTTYRYSDNAVTRQGLLTCELATLAVATRNYRSTSTAENRRERQFRAITLALQQLLSDDAPRIALKGEERIAIWFM